MTHAYRVKIYRPGSYERLCVEEDAVREPHAGEVRIAVEAIGVNYADCVVRMGLYEPAAKYVGWPITPGFEVAGRVDAVGNGVTTVAPGDDVIAVTRFGGYTSSLVVPERQVFTRPHHLSAAQGAGMMTIFLTAYYALFELAQVQPGHVVLIHSAAGGVGSALTQMARHAGCSVLGVVGASHKCDHVQSLGAHCVIDKSREIWWKHARTFSSTGYQAIFDANGASTLQQSYQLLASPGRLVIYGFHSMLPKQGGRPNWLKLAWDYLRTPRFNPLDLTGRNHAIMGFNLAYLFDQQESLRKTVNTLMDWVEGGQIQPPHIKTYPLEKVQDAHRDLESGQTVGKLVLLL